MKTNVDVETMLKERLPKIMKKFEPPEAQETISLEALEAWVAAAKEKKQPNDQEKVCKEKEERVKMISRSKTSAGYVVEFFKKEKGEVNGTAAVLLTSYGYWTGKKYRFEKNEDEFFPFCTPGVEFDGKTKIFKGKKQAIREAATLMEHVNSAVCGYAVKKTSSRTVYLSQLKESVENV